MSETPEPQDGFTLLFNPATGDPWNCPDAAVENWKALGWTDQPHAAKSFSSMNKPQLLKAAVDRGIEVPEGATNPEIVALLTGSES